MKTKPHDGRYLEWWRRGELNRFASLIPRKLFILRSTQSSQISQNAEVRYTAAIRRSGAFSSEDCAPNRSCFNRTLVRTGVRCIREPSDAPRLVNQFVRPAFADRRRAFNFVRIGIVSSGLPWKDSFLTAPRRLLGRGSSASYPFLTRPRRNR